MKLKHLFLIVAIGMLFSSCSITSNFVLNDDVYYNPYDSQYYYLPLYVGYPNYYYAYPYGGYYSPYINQWYYSGSVGKTNYGHRRSSSTDRLIPTKPRNSFRSTNSSVRSSRSNVSRSSGSSKAGRKR